MRGRPETSRTPAAPGPTSARACVCQRVRRRAWGVGPRAPTQRDRGAAPRGPATERGRWRDFPGLSLLQPRAPRVGSGCRGGAGTGKPGKEGVSRRRSPSLRHPRSARGRGSRLGLRPPRRARPAPASRPACGLARAALAARGLGAGAGRAAEPRAAAAAAAGTLRPHHARAGHRDRGPSLALRGLRVSSAAPHRERGRAQTRGAADRAPLRPNFCWRPRGEPGPGCQLLSLSRSKAASSGDPFLASLPVSRDPPGPLPRRAADTGHCRAPG